jgi:hypothetical protein
MHLTTPRTTKIKTEKENSLIFQKNTNTKQFSHERVHSFSPQQRQKIEPDFAKKEH